MSNNLKVQTLKIQDVTYDIYDPEALHLGQSLDEEGLNLGSSECQATGKYSIAIGDGVKALEKNSLAQGSDIYKDNAEYLKNREGKYYVESGTCELAKEYPDNCEIINKESLESIIGPVILTSSGGYCLASDLRHTEAHGTSSLAAGQGAVAYSRSSKALGYRVQTGNPYSIEDVEERPEITSLISAANAILDEGVTVTPVVEDEEIIDYEFNIPANKTIKWNISQDFVPCMIYLRNIAITTGNCSYSPTLKKDKICDFNEAGTFIITAGASGCNFKGLQIYLIPEDNVGQASTAIGADTAAVGNQSFAGGWRSYARGYNSLAFGAECNANGFNSIVMGHNANANAARSVAIGLNAKEQADGSTYFTKTNGNMSVAIASNSETKGTYSAIIGGQNNITNKHHSATLGGLGLTTNKETQVVIGKYNEPDENALFIIGNGEYEKPNNAVVIDSYGKYNGVDIEELQKSHNKVYKEVFKESPSIEAQILPILDTHEGWFSGATSSWRTEKTEKVDYSAWRSRLVPCKPGDKIQVVINSKADMEPYYRGMVVAFFNEPTDLAENYIAQGSSDNSTDTTKRGQITVPNNENIKYAWISFYNTTSMQSAIIYKVENFVPYTDLINNLLIPNNSPFKWAGKKWVAFGTSITAPASSGIRKYTYATLLEGLSGMILDNRGVGSGSITKGIGGYSSDYSGKILEAIEKFVEEDTSDVALITLEVGANDIGATKGNYYDLTDDTYCGCLNYCIKLLQEKTNAQILILSSPNSRTKDENNTTDDGDIETAKNFYEYAKLTKECCEFNCVPYLGLESNLGFRKLNVKNSPYIYFDGVPKDIHQSYQGAYILATSIWEKLKTLPLFY